MGRKSPVRNGLDNQGFEEGPSAARNGEPTYKPEFTLGPEEIPESEIRSTKIKILRNIFIISFAFLLNFTAFNSMANLQSSLNETLGTTSLSVIYVSLVLSCAFVPSWLIKKLKTKWTLPICMLCYSSYMAAQMYPRYYTLIPTAIMVGLGAAPMWSAQCSYFTQAGEVYGNALKEDSEVVITRFFGIFFLFFQTSNVWGGIISSTILSSGVEDVERSSEFLDHCGADFCPSFAANMTALSGKNTTTDEEESAAKKTKVITIAVIFLCCSIAAAAIIALFVDPLPRIGVKEKDYAGKSGKALLVATFTHMKKIYQILIIPLTMWSGLEQAYFQADFTAAFVTCGLGVHMVGYILICYGICDAISSISFSPLVKRFGRIPIFTFGAVLNLIMLAMMNMWEPHPNDFAIFFIIAGLWGISDAIWQTQINALYGVIFPGESEAAFSNYRLWESLGFILAFIWSAYVCIDAKMYTLIALLLVGMTGYYTIEILEKTGGLKINGKKIESISDL